MKNVLGGKKYAVVCTADPGYSVAQPGSCEGTLSACQQAANNWCNSANHCASCTVQ